MEFEDIKELAEGDIQEFCRFYALNLLMKKWFQEKDEEVLEEIKKLMKK